MVIFECIYYVGIAICAIQGVDKTKVTKSYDLSIVSAFFTAFGGGLIRDIIFLQVYPAVFKYGSILDITIVMLSAVLFNALHNYIGPSLRTKRLIIILDAAGIGTFIIIGVNNAMSANASLITIILCGWITSIGGGFVSSLLCGISIRSAMLDNIPYRIVPLLASLLYLYMLSVGFTSSQANTLIIIGVFIPILLLNPYIRKDIIKQIQIHFQIISNQYSRTSFTPSYVQYLIWNTNFNTNRYVIHYLKRIKNNSKVLWYRTIKRYLLYHKLLRI